MNLVKDFSIRNHAETDGVINASQAGAMLGGASGLGTGEVKPTEAMKNFMDKRPSDYLFMMDLLHKISGLGFETRGSQFRKDALDYFNRHAPKPGTGLFAVNSGIPAGGQLKALVDLPLTDTSLGYFNENFIGKQILTNSPVMFQTGLIGQYGNEHNVEYNKREVLADGRANVRQIYPYSTDFTNYAVATYALMDTLSQNDYRNYRLPFNAEQDLTIAIKLLLMLVCEIDIATQIQDSTGYPSSSVITLASADDRFDHEDSSVDTQARTLRASILDNCGYAPNTMVCDENVFDALSRHKDNRGTIFQDLSKSRTASAAEVMKLFKVNRLLIGKTAKTSDPGKNAQLSRVWGKDIWLGYVAPMRALRQQTFGYYHHYQNADSYVITRQSTGNPENRDVFCYQSWQHHIINKNCGGLIKMAIS